jgi:hypothetical protein
MMANGRLWRCQIEPGKAGHDQVELAGVLLLTATGTFALSDLLLFPRFCCSPKFFCHEGLAL